MIFIYVVCVLYNYSVFCCWLIRRHDPVWTSNGADINEVLKIQDDQQNGHQDEVHSENDLHE